VKSGNHPRGGFSGILTRETEDGRGKPLAGTDPGRGDLAWTVRDSLSYTIIFAD